MRRFIGRQLDRIGPILDSEIFSSEMLELSMMAKMARPASSNPFRLLGPYEAEDLIQERKRGFHQGPGRQCLPIV